MTGSANTARLITRALTGRASAGEFAPFAPERF
jgi:hypothetical protein